MVNVFVGGRICLLGEHSDWASEYSKVNNKIVRGSSIIAGLNQGIGANVEKNDNFVIKNNSNIFEVSMDSNKLLEIINSNNYYSYCCSVAYHMLNKYNVGGIVIDIIKEDLPIKKGLASSASICVLVANAFNKIYNLNLTTQDIMNIAYESERLTGSNCGRMDQLCAYGVGLNLVIYNDKLEVKKINLCKNLYIVYADLNGKKDTKTILNDLNAVYPFSKKEKDEKLYDFFGKRNNEIISEAIGYLEKGDYEKLGILMTRTQKEFDEKVGHYSKELNAPILHKYLENDNLNKYIYGSKGVGSQGDGTIQFIARNEECQRELINVLKKDGLKAYPLTINADFKIRKAVIPVAGKATRLYPYTKVISKEFSPVVYNNMLVPQISVLLNEVDDVNIDEICLGLSSNVQKEMYEKFFNNSVEYLDLLSDDKREFDLNLKKLYKKLHFIDASKSLGFGHTVSMFKEFANNEPVLLLLGDTLYKSNTSDNCVKQLLDAYSEYKKTMIGLVEIPVEESVNYGICYGEKINDNVIRLTKIIEKPSSQYARNNLLIDGKLYGIFGNYIIDNRLFEELENKMKTCNNNVEMQLTDSLESVREKYGSFGVIINGKSFDFGNVNSYIKNFNNLGE